MGQVAFNAGIAKSLFDCALHKFLGHIAGGLAIAPPVGPLYSRQFVDSQGYLGNFCKRCKLRDGSIQYSRKLSTGIVGLLLELRTYSAQCDPHNIWHQHAVVDRQAVYGWVNTGVNTGCFGIVAHGWCRLISN